MSSPGEGPEDAIAFGQRLLSLLDTGSFTTTYKYATLLAIIDQTLAHVGSKGQPPRRLPVAVLGERVLELYWQQARPFGESGPLRQGMRGDVPSRIGALRRDLELPSGARLEVTRKQHPDQIAALQQEVTDTVGRYPVPLLQRFGPGRTAEEDRFVYDYDWAPGSIPGPDAGIVFVEDAAEHLMTLAGLLRPLVHREWARFVASRNQLEQDSIEEFLFGARRRSLQSLRAPLRNLYTGRCFYCEGELRSSFEIDHFLPWAKFPDDRLDNLVPAHRSCNNDKREASTSTKAASAASGPAREGPRSRTRAGSGISSSLPHETSWTWQPSSEAATHGRPNEDRSGTDQAEPSVLSPRRPFPPPSPRPRAWQRWVRAPQSWHHRQPQRLTSTAVCAQARGGGG